MEPKEVKKELDKVYGSQGYIHITPSETSVVQVFDIVGREQFNRTLIKKGSYAFPFPMGLYSIQIGNETYEVMVK